MIIKKIISTVLIVTGIAGLIIGLFGIFGPDITQYSPWTFAILGIIFFASGISILKTIETKDTSVSS